MLTDPDNRTMSEIFNERYLVTKYELDLKSIISKCNCISFDVINSNVDEILCEIIAYVFTWTIPTKPRELVYELKRAVDIYCKKFEKQSYGVSPGFKERFYEQYAEYIVRKDEEDGT